MGELAVIIIVAVLVWVSVCFIAGAIDAWLEQRKWEKQRKDRESDTRNMKGSSRGQ